MIAETVAEASRRFGDRPVLVAEEGWSLSFGDLHRLSDEVAAGLSSRGVRPGQVVALILPPGPEHFVAYAAVAKLGAVTAAVNHRLSAAEREGVLHRAAPQAVLATADLVPGAGGPPSGATAAAGESERSVVLEVRPATAPEEVLSNLRRPGEAPPELESDPERPVAIVFTSGTTGLPKGATFCGRQLEFITRCDVGEGWGGGGPALAGSALAHLGPMTKWPGTLRRGSTQHLTSAWAARQTLERVERLRIPAIGGVPTQLALMLRDPDFDRFDLSSVRAIVIGGGPATPSLVREARARFGAALAVRYSCTEAGIGTGTAFDDPEEDAEVTVGRPQPGVEMAILDGEGGEVAPGEEGEVCLRSPAVMAGYWADPDATAAAVAPGGWVRTGDIGWRDERGRLHLAGRSKERYVRGGFNVHPSEVESVLVEHPDVAAVAVVGRVDEVMGELGVALVVVHPGQAAPSVEALRDFAAPRLARYKLPDDVMVVDALPLTAMDKVDRRALAEMAAPERSGLPGSAP